MTRGAVIANRTSLAVAIRFHDRLAEHVRGGPAIVRQFDSAARARGKFDVTAR
jgi:hypothetical protein